MKISSKFILPITLLVVFAGIVGVVSINMTLKKTTGEQQKTLTDFTHNSLSAQAKIRQNSIYSTIDQVGKAALAEAALFSEVPDIQDVYELANSGNINDENDIMMQQARQKLRIVMSAYIDGLTKQTDAKNFRIHFHTSSNRSLARLWRKGWQAKRNGKKVDISDDLSSFRKTVVQINQGDHKPISGIEIGRGGFAIRGLAAVKGFDGEHVGSVEVLGSFDDVLKANHTDDSYQIAVYMLSEMLPIATRLQDPAKNPVLDGKYVFVSSTDRGTTDSIITSSLLDAGRNGYSEQVSGDQFVTSFPISDFSGKTVGVMALAYDMTEANALIHSIEQAGKKTVSSMGWRFGIGALLLVIVICGTIFYVTRRVIGPLRMAVGAAQRIALGDLRESVDYSSRDEVGELAGAINTMIDSLKAKAEEAQQIAQGNLQLQVSVASENDSMGQAFKAMVENLNEVLGEVARASEQINAGSHQVSDTAQSLSQGATESAASLEEISSSMNEIGSQTQQSATNASQASQFTHSAQSAAQTGSERMGSMVEAMNEINEAGQNISKIIKVIDEIAFQTNLLALNAAVEAARAGQHGKGFAVVAEEVRNLAARSAKAAEETAQLIEGSVEKANNGTQIAQKTAEALDEIVSSITKATDLVAEIAAASNEQAQGISQINEGLGQIDQGVQQSTATAEESAAAAEELSSQSEHLKQMLGRFKLAAGNLFPPAAPLASPSPKPQTLGWGGSAQQPAAPSKIQLDDEDFGKY